MCTWYNTLVIAWLAGVSDLDLFGVISREAFDDEVFVAVIRF